MAPNLYEVSSLKYKDRVPSGCFLAKLPDWLQYCSDNAVSPSHEFAVEGNVKYIRASRYRDFVMECQRFARHPLSATAVGAQKIELRVVVMPYMSLRDAYDMHQLISEPDMLPDTFQETAKFPHPDQGDNKSDLGLRRLLHEQDEEDEEEEGDENAVAAQWEMKRGSLPVNGLCGHVEFVVLNYSFLWSKAEKYCKFKFMADPLQDILHKLGVYDNLVHKPPPHLLHEFNDRVERARRHLIFAMYLDELDPHDIIHSFYPYVHNRVYLDCVLCQPDAAEDAADDSPETMSRLFEELNDLGLQEFDASITVENAQYNLMKQEGFLEEFLLKSGSMKSFTRSEEQFQSTVQVLLQNLNLATVESTMMGVSSMFLHED